MFVRLIDRPNIATSHANDVKCTFVRSRGSRVVYGESDCRLWQAESSINKNPTLITVDNIGLAYGQIILDCQLKILEYLR